MQVVHTFSTFQWFVLASIGYEGCCCKITDIHASVLLAFQHMGVSSFDILLYLLLLLKNAITYGLVFVHVVLTMLCSYSVLG